MVLNKLLSDNIMKGINYIRHEIKVYYGFLYIMKYSLIHSQFSLISPLLTSPYIPPDGLNISMDVTRVSILLYQVSLSYVSTFSTERDV